MSDASGVRRIGFLVFPGFQLLDATGPIAAFEVASRFAENAYALDVLSPDGGTVASSSGVRLDSRPMTKTPALDTLVVAGGDGVRAAHGAPGVLDFIAAQGREARRVASVCTGAFLLAAAGLLAGRRATTHWGAAAAFQRLHPSVRLEPDRIFVRDGPVWTSAGITAGIDLTLALVAEDLGEAVAKATARQLVVFHRRPGGQSQFSGLLELDPGEDRFARVLGWARERLAEPLPVERLAETAGLSPRQFARAFLAATGVTPAKAVERLRVEAVRAALESGETRIDQLAPRFGFGAPERMRRAFLRTYGQPPQALKRQAHRQAADEPPASDSDLRAPA